MGFDAERPATRWSSSTTSARPRVLRFTNLERNPKVDARNFRFTPPKGADVLRYGVK